MRVDFNFISLLLGFLCIVSIARSASAATPTDPFLGIAPQDEKYFQSSDTIWCRDGSKKFTRAQLNDDFCDCPDATDEPGTSACPGGKFYCRNVGHASLLLFSSRVNDGICDCCDGSDEYDGTVNCPNTCWEAGKVARDKLKKKIATYQEGVTVRRHEIEKAKAALVNDEAELSKLKSEEKILAGLVQQLKERKEQIEKAEEKERVQKEKEEKEKKEAEEKVNQEEAGEEKSKSVEEAEQEKSKSVEEAEQEKSISEEEAEQEKSKSEEEAEQEKSKSEEKADGEYKPVESILDDEIGIIEDSPSHQHSAVDKENIIFPEESKEDSAAESETNHDAGSKDKGSMDEVKKVENDASENPEALSSEELGRLVASRWTGENTAKHSGESDMAKDNQHPEDDGGIPEDAHHEEYNNYASDTDEENSSYGSYDDDNDDVEDEIDEDYSGTHDSTSSYTADSHDEPDFSETTSDPTWLEKIGQTVRNILKAVNLFQIPVDKSEAEHVRKEYEESNAKLSKLKSRISTLTAKLKLDFGPEKEFYSFYDRCFEGKQNKYVYKVCPYKQATQTEGHSTTRLGNWEKFEEVNKVMLFSHGDKCWNGPDRSLKVKLRCGLKNEVTDVDEPSRCEYLALLSTPALCSEEKLKELQDKLELLNKEQPHGGHDEL